MHWLRAFLRLPLGCFSPSACTPFGGRCPFSGRHCRFRSPPLRCAAFEGIAKCDLACGASSAFMIALWSVSKEIGLALESREQNSACLITCTQQTCRSSVRDLFSSYSALPELPLAGAGWRITCLTRLPSTRHFRGKRLSANCGEGRNSANESQRLVNSSSPNRIRTPSKTG